MFKASGYVGGVWKSEDLNYVYIYILTLLILTYVNKLYDAVD